MSSAETYSEELAPEDLLIAVGDVLRQLREASGLRQRDLARKIGASQATISYLENGSSNTRVSTIFRVAQALGQDVEINFVEQEEYSDEDSIFDEALKEAMEEMAGKES